MSPPIAAVSIVCFRGEDVLLIRRARAPLAGQWAPPGGRIEGGEAAPAAALRELREEAAISAELCGLAGIVDRIAADSHFVLICYAARWLNGAPHAGDDAAEARFFAPADLPALGLDPQIGATIIAARRLVGA